MARELTADSGIAQIRACTRGTLETARSGLVRIQKVCDVVGYDALVTQLGGDPSEITSAYEAFRSLVTSLDPTAVVEDLRT